MRDPRRMSPESSAAPWSNPRHYGTVAEAAAAVQRSPATIWRWAAAGLIERRRWLGRTLFDLREVRAVAKAEPRAIAPEQP